MANPFLSNVQGLQTSVVGQLIPPQLELMQGILQGVDPNVLAQSVAPSITVEGFFDTFAGEEGTAIAGAQNRDTFDFFGSPTSSIDSFGLVNTLDEPPEGDPNQKKDLPTTLADVAGALPSQDPFEFKPHFPGTPSVPQGKDFTSGVLAFLQDIMGKLLTQQQQSSRPNVIGGLNPPTSFTQIIDRTI